MTFDTMIEAIVLSKSVGICLSDSIRKHPSPQGACAYYGVVCGATVCGHVNKLEMIYFSRQLPKASHSLSM